MSVTEKLKDLMDELLKNEIVLRSIKVTTYDRLGGLLINEGGQISQIPYPFEKEGLGWKNKEHNLILENHPFRLEYIYPHDLSRENFFKWRPFFEKVYKLYKDPLGAEIGVFEGFLAKYVLRYISPKIYYLVDPHKPYCDDIGELDFPEETWNTIHIEVCKRFKFNSAAQIVRKESLEAAKDIPDGTLDFCYIDGDHSFDAVYKDICAWFPKVRAGGLIGGHDFTEAEVKSGVFKFIVTHNKDLGIDGGLNDWWFVKPGDS